MKVREIIRKDTIRVLERLRRRMRDQARRRRQTATDESLDVSLQSHYYGEAWGLDDAQRYVRDEIKKLKEGK